MRSKEFIIEGDVKKSALLKIVELIKKDCQPYLQEAQPFTPENSLLRGLGSSTQTFMKKAIRLDDRKPKDIPLELHNRINDFFDQKYGESFRNAMFCSSDYIQAENYGIVYYIFPIGEFKSLWNPNVEDLFMLYDEYAPWFKPGSTSVSPEEQKQRTQEAMDEFFEEGKHYLGFGSVPEAVRQFGRLIDKAEYADYLSLRAYEEVIEKHTYDHRIQQILDTVFE